MQNAECKVQNEGLTAEEIVRSLRVCNNIDGLCRGCVYSGNCGGDILCADQLREAATAMIEELAERIGELEGQLILKNGELLKLREENRWIPTSERLPELDDGTTLLDGEMVAVQVLAMIQGAKKSTCLYFDGEDFFDYTGDELIPYRVTRWKPMPKETEEAGQV